MKIEIVMHDVNFTNINYAYSPGQVDKSIV